MISIVHHKSVRFDQVDNLPLKLILGREQLASLLRITQLKSFSTLTASCVGFLSDVEIAKCRTARYIKKFQVKEQIVADHNSTDEGALNTVPKGFLHTLAVHRSDDLSSNIIDHQIL